MGSSMKAGAPASDPITVTERQGMILLEFGEVTAVLTLGAAMTTALRLQAAINQALGAGE